MTNVGCNSDCVSSESIKNRRGAIMDILVGRFSEVNSRCVARQVAQSLSWVHLAVGMPAKQR
jgi:hypothetical protein